MNPTPAPALRSAIDPQNVATWPDWLIKCAEEIGAAEMPTMSHFVSMTACEIARAHIVARVMLKHLTPFLAPAPVEQARKIAGEAVDIAVRAYQMPRFTREDAVKDVAAIFAAHFQSLATEKPTSSPGETTEQLNQNAKDVIVSGAKRQAFDSPGETGGEACGGRCGDPHCNLDVEGHLIPAQSQTPMTDARTFPSGSSLHGKCQVVKADFARTLETALASAKERVGELTKERDKLIVQGYDALAEMTNGVDCGGGIPAMIRLWRADRADQQAIRADRDALAEKLRRVEGENARLGLALKMRQDAEDPAIQAHYQKVSEEEAPSEKPKCGHVIAYADPKDAIPCPVCDRDALAENLRRAEGERDYKEKEILAAEEDAKLNRYDFIALQSQLRELGEQLALAKKDIAERIATFHADRPNGEWIDRWGACRVCGGEIPHGHTENCDHYKQEKEIMALRTRLAALQQTVGEADKDTARLKWLEDRIVKVYECMASDTPFLFEHVPAGYGLRDDTDLRKSIDVSMKQK